VNDAGSLLGRAGFSLPAVDTANILQRPQYSHVIYGKYTRALNFVFCCQDTITYNFPDAMTLMHALQVFRKQKTQKNKPFARV
jgi:hypothetical protein